MSAQPMSDSHATGLSPSACASVGLPRSSRSSSWPSCSHSDAVWVVVCRGLEKPCSSGWLGFRGNAEQGTKGMGTRERMQQRYDGILGLLELNRHLE